MLDYSFAYVAILLIFIFGYAAIIFEHSIRINKAASALVVAVFTWTILFLTPSQNFLDHNHVLNEHLSSTSQIIFFLLGALLIVELIDSHRGFKIITDIIRTKSRKSLLWTLGLITFFLSAVLDNLTTTVVMVTLLRKILSNRDDRILFGSLIVIAANAGGAWTPMGDITTTMLWINGNITSLAIIKSLFLPSFFSLIVALFLIERKFEKKRALEWTKTEDQPPEPGARSIFYLGLSGLIFVPIFKTLTGLPPFMGILIVLGILWMTTDLMHHNQKHRQHLLIQHTLTRIDTSGVLFFFGILLCIGSLDAIGILKGLESWLDQFLHHRLSLIAFVIGILSAVIDNVPLVAATMSMFDFQTYPPDSSLWQMLAYTAGTGGSLLIIGSAAGIALMGLEKINFVWYLKNITALAFFSYLSGFLFYLLQTTLLG